jgi:hypothetical protein
MLFRGSEYGDVPPVDGGLGEKDGMSILGECGIKSKIPARDHILSKQPRRV